MTGRLSEIKQLQKAIVSALESGDHGQVAGLRDQLARVRAEIASELEVD